MLPQSLGNFLDVVTGSPPSHVAGQLLECPGHETFAGLCHATLECFNLEFACLDEVGDVETTCCHILDRNIGLSALWYVSSISLGTGLALLAGDITLSRHVGQIMQDLSLWDSRR